MRVLIRLVRFSLSASVRSSAVSASRNASSVIDPVHGRAIEMPGATPDANPAIACCGNPYCGYLTAPARPTHPGADMTMTSNPLSTPASAPPGGRSRSRRSAPGRSIATRRGEPRPPQRTRCRVARTLRERELFARYRGRSDLAARDELVGRFLPLATRLAQRYHRGAEPLDDLVQVASVGLLKAIDRFDPERGTAFSSFAVPTIAGELKRYFRDKGWALRVPRALQELTQRVDHTTESPR